MILDAGVFVAVDRREARAQVLFEALGRVGESLHTSEAVVAQVWRNGARQARLASILKGVDVHQLNDGRAIGGLLAASGGTDVVDAHVVLLGASLTQRVFTTDLQDLRAIAAPLGPSGPDILTWA